jgi:hypothetical protein
VRGTPERRAAERARARTLARTFMGTSLVLTCGFRCWGWRLGGLVEA